MSKSKAIFIFKTIIIFVWIFSSVELFSQDTIPHFINDTLIAINDTITNDTIIEQKKEKALKAKVDYHANDSIRLDAKNQKVFLFGGAEISYQNINLKAAYIEINFKTNTVFAKGVPDSTGKVQGMPVFSEGGQEFDAETMKYNFDTKKGLIKHVVTHEGEGYIHGEKIKKLEDGNINISSGSYTTCDNKDHPHYEFRYKKSKVIPNDKIITGPAYLVIADVPTPLFIPFGMFPNKKGQRSGIIIPSYGESANRGFFFEGGGYYWAINDYLDFKLTGDIYTRGSWAIKPLFRYSKRYKYKGSFNFNYGITVLGDKGSPDYSKNRDFAIRWSHQQDPKARPSSTFSANVNIVSKKYNKFNPTSTEQYLTNTFQSSIAYQKNWNQKYFLTVDLSHSQNTIDETVTMNLPQISFSVNRFNPFRKKEKVGEEKWYDKISVNYSMNAKNYISTYDSLLFKPEMYSDMQNGIKHNVSVSSPLKILKYFNMTNSITLTDRMYFDKLDKYWVNDSIFTETDTTIGYVKTDTLPGFNNEYDFSFSSSVSTRIYGMVGFKKGPIKAIRHVISPSISFSFRPDFGAAGWGYYKYHYNNAAHTDSTQYSIHERFIFGGAPRGKSGSISFGISNNLEIKVRSRKDTITGYKKIKLIENFSISTAYNLAADSLKWSKVSMRGNTTLFKNINITYSSSWDPYVLDSSGTRNLNKFEWDVNHRLLRLDNTSWTTGLSWSLNSKKTDKKKVSKKGDEQELKEINENPDEYVDWSIPWKLNIRYTLNYGNNLDYINNKKTNNKSLIQTMSVNGEINVTPKWRIGFNSGYNFQEAKVTTTSINIYRDLHCWEMRFSWIPMGFRKSWNFSINVKSSILQDLKLSKKKDFRDYY
ncbi:MAG: LPS-assembly protein LptD [Bacteroidales bacterium]|nr:LPS-assembly protein LptD [Bacteroidales bacterium]